MREPGCKHSPASQRLCSLPCPLQRSRHLCRQGLHHLACLPAFRRDSFHTVDVHGVSQPRFPSPIRGHSSVEQGWTADQQPPELNHQIPSQGSRTCRLRAVCGSRYFGVGRVFRLATCVTKSPYSIPLLKYPVCLSQQK